MLSSSPAARYAIITGSFFSIAMCQEMRVHQMGNIMHCGDRDNFLKNIHIGNFGGSHYPNPECLGFGCCEATYATLFVIWG